MATSNCLPTCYVPPDSRPYANSCCHEFFIGSSRPKLVAWLGTSSHLGYWPSECILLSSRSSSSPASINSPTNLSPRVLHPVNYTTTDSWFQLAFPVPLLYFPQTYVILSVSCSYNEQYANESEGPLDPSARAYGQPCLLVLSHGTRPAGSCPPNYFFSSQSKTF